MTNIALGFVLYLPLDSHLELYISYKPGGSALSNTNRTLYSKEVVIELWLGSYRMLE